MRKHRGKHLEQRQLMNYCYQMRHQLTVSHFATFIIAVSVSRKALGLQ